MGNEKDNLNQTEKEEKLMPPAEEQPVEQVRPKKPSIFRRINYRKVIKYVIILGIIGGGVFYVRSRMQKGLQTQEETIMTEAAAYGDVNVELSGKGTVEPLDKYNVTTLVKGEVLNAPFEEGQKVKKGELLFQISTKDVESSIKSAELQVKRAKKSYADTVDGLTELTMTSKVAGYVKDLHVEKGDMITAGTVIADVYDDSKMLIDLPFPADQVSSAWVGKKAVIEIDGSLENITGKITEVNKFEEVLPGNIIVKKVTIQVTNPGGISTSTTAIASVGDVDCNDYGTFRPLIEDKIVADKSGEVTSISLKKGSYVKKGTTIIRLSTKSVNTQIENSKLGIEESELALETQKDQLENYRIDAPISGQVILKNKKSGDTIDPSDGTGPLAIIYDLSSLTFKMSIDELDIMRIQVGQEVNITAEAIPDEVFKGVVENISLNSTTVNGVTSYPVQVRIDEIGSLLPGMNVTGKIITAHADNVIIIPSDAIMRGDFVYVKDPNYSAEDKLKMPKAKAGQSSEEPVSDAPEGFQKVKVEIGLSDGAFTEIISGIKEKDEVYIPSRIPTSIGGFGMTAMGGGGAQADDFYEE